MVDDQGPTNDEAKVLFGEQHRSNPIADDDSILFSTATRFVQGVYSLLFSAKNRSNI
jgi:hypothetical protein